MKGRLVIALVFAGCWCAAIGLRLVQLQVVHHDYYAEAARSQQREVVEIRSPRGTIYDARGRELAVSMPVDSACADPREIEDPVATARAVAKIAGVDAERLANRLASDRHFVWVARQLDPPQARRLADLELPGIRFCEESKRYYPLRELAGPVVGYVNTDNLGLAGLELEYESAIAGRPVRRVLLQDAHQDTAPSPRQPFTEVEPGEDLHLTLDATIQLFAEQELERAVTARRARGGSVILLEPRSGAVLAMASYPGFDPNRRSDFSQERWRNRAIEDAYEPGSTFKMVTAAAALAANAVDPGDVLDCGRGSITLGGTVIRDHKSFDLLTFREVIARSSNVGAIKAGLSVPPEELHEMIRGFGFGGPTGVDLPGESSGILRPVEHWQPLTAAYVSFGQGLSVTPLQLATAFAAVANGGILPRPHLVAAVGREGAPAPRSHRADGPRVIPEATARELERLLEGVVTDGTAKRAAIPGYRVAGKTGTAQKAVDGRYSGHRFVASFVGFAPARDPAIVALVVIDEPRPPAYHGGQVAAPVFAAVVERALLYLGVAPEPQPAPAPEEILLAEGTAGEAAEGLGIPLTVEADGGSG